jgi:threonine aldolase
MNFASDNITGGAPEILQALAAENGGDCLPYGDDDYTKAAEKLFNDVFEADVGVMMLATGTAANALALACTTPNYGAIFCRRGAHFEASEGGAVEHLTGGARLVLIDAPSGVIDAKTLDAAISGYSPSARFFRPSVVSITQASELGTVYSLDEIRAIAEVAHRHGMKLHVDGARWSNAIVTLGCSPAEMSWKAGVDILSFGATKNGAIAAEAVVFFDKALMEGAAERRKKAGMLVSKHRFLAVQWQAFFADDLWLRLAHIANEHATALGKGLAGIKSVVVTHKVQANEVFAQLSEPVIDRLAADGFQFYRRGGGVIRLVTSYETTEDAVDHFVTATKGHMEQDSPR